MSTSSSIKEEEIEDQAKEGWKLTADNSKHPYTQLNCRLARTQIEVNLFFVLMHSQKKKTLKKSNTENKVTPGNGLPWHQALLWGKREKKIDPVFCLFCQL